MKVRYKVSMGGPRGIACSRGDEAKVSAEEAERLIAKGFAEPVKSQKRKTATSRKAEQAETRADASEE